MLLKLVYGSMFAVFTGALIFGAVNRTAARIDDPSPSIARNSERNAERAANFAEHKAGQQIGKEETDGRAGAGRGRELQSDVPEPKGRSQANGRQMGQKDPSQMLGNPELETYEGIVVEATEDTLTLEAGLESPLIVEGRAWHYSQEMGFIPMVGDNILLEGYYEDAEYKLVFMTNMSANTIIQLREITGRPAWAGGGKQGDNSTG